MCSSSSNLQLSSSSRSPPAATCPACATPAATAPSKVTRLASNTLQCPSAAALYSSYSPICSHTAVTPSGQVVLVLPPSFSAVCAGSMDSNLVLSTAAVFLPVQRATISTLSSAATWSRWSGPTTPPSCCSSRCACWLQQLHWRGSCRRAAPTAFGRYLSMRCALWMQVGCSRGGLVGWRLLTCSTHSKTCW